MENITINSKSADKTFKSGKELSKTIIAFVVLIICLLFTLFAFSQDLGVTAITTPTTTCGAGAQTVTIAIKNFDPIGSIGISGGNASTVTYQLDGGGTVSEIYTLPTIPPQQTVTYAFTTMLTIPQGISAHTIVSCVTLNGDPNPANDCFTQSNIYNYPQIANNTISSNQTICTNQTPTPLTGTSPTGGDNTYTYQWQSSTTSPVAGYANIAGATSPNYSPGLLTVTTYFQRIVSTIVTCTANTSNAITITVNPGSLGGTTSGAATVCSGSNSGTVTLSGDSGSVVKWQQSVNGGSTYTDILSNTTATLNYTNITQTTLYRAVVQKGACPPDNSTATQITVDPVTVGGSVLTSTNVCNGSNSGTLTLTGQTGAIQNWQFSTDGGATWSNIANTTTTQTYSNITVTTQYRAVVKSGTCASANSNPATLTVDPVSVGGFVSFNAIECGGNNNAVLTLNSQTGSVIKWQSSIDGGTTWSNITNSTTTLNYVNLTQTTEYRAVVQSGSCPAVNSNPATITIVPTPTSSFTIVPNSVCLNTDVTITYTGSATAAAAYTWDFDGGSVTSGSGQGPYQIQWSGTGIKNVTLSVTESGCTSAVTTNTITVNPTLATVVSISPSPGNTICAGDNVTFTATPTNGGTTPTYQWKLNGTNVGTNSVNYNNSSLVNGDVVTCDMTSNATCPGPVTATSNAVTMTVNPILTPDVSIAASPSSTICIGDNVTFTATPNNGGSTPIYQWKLNGTNVGSNSNVYSNNSLSNGDAITCDMTTNATCPSTATVTSNTITMTVSGILVPSVNVTADQNPICAGANVIFTATPTNGGATPSFQWQLNGGNVGTNSNTYANNTLSNGDQVTCVLTSSLPCAVPSSMPGNTVIITVSANLTPAISIAASPGTTDCAGDNVTFTATPTNGGSTPTYQWMVNGSNVGTNSATYSTTTLANGDVVTCDLTSSISCASPSPNASSNPLTMTINANVVPAVSIGANPGSTICAGDNVTFTATPTNGGATPTYQWKVNGANVGTNTNTYSDNTLANGDVVTCIMTSNATCPSPATATDNITMSVNPIQVPSVSIAANPGTTICAGDNVTFTATPTNGGSSPVYQWKVNGGNVGTNSNTYSSTSLSDADVVTCDLTSNAVCPTPATVTSNTITMTVNPVLVPVINISVNPGSTICNGDNVTFTATPTNGGSTPTYQWMVNGLNVGANSTTYSSSSLADGDVVSCDLTSNATCATPTTVSSNAITMTVNPILIPSLIIDANPGTTLCAGDNITFTATPTNGGTTPTYQWKVNGNNVGANSNTYNTTSLSNNDVVTCDLTSNATCANPTLATSNALIMTVNPIQVPSVNISANPGTTICAGDNVTFTATPVNGGSTPAYQWKVNGVNVGSNTTTYSSSALADGDVVACDLTSNATCATPAIVTSNTITMTVNPILVPSVLVTTPSSTICVGTTADFTATPTNGGSAPTYQWQLNGVNVAGATSSTYSNSSLSNNDVVSCSMTSNATCASPSTVTSNAITMTVNSVTPSISIAANPGTTACLGATVTFTATPVNGGSTPTYQWKVNGGNVGINNSTYSTNTLANNDVVTCDLTSNAACATPPTVTSNAITMTVNSVTPSVSIAANPGTTICLGANVTFTATPVNGGTTPSYQWKVNGNNVGNNGATYSTTSLANNDVVTCDLTSNAACTTSATVTSNAISMTVNSNTPVVSIAANPGTTVCAGTSVVFTATPINGGTSPSYQWKLNGGNVGTNSTTYSNTSLANGDVITCVLTSNVSCASSPTAVSNTIAMNVNPMVIPSLSISTTSGTSICAGDNVTFTATPSNGGANPVYQWKLNGNAVGANSATYTNNSLANGDAVSCDLTSSNACANPTTASSNVLNMTVNPVGGVVSVTISASPSTTFCSGTNVTFTANAVNGGTSPTYEWRWNGGIVGSNSQTLTSGVLRNGDVIVCNIISSNFCLTTNTATSNSIVVTVANNPNATITSSGPTNFCEGSSLTLTASGGNTYLWNTGETADTIVVNQSGTYNVMVTNSAGCTAFGGIQVSMSPAMQIGYNSTSPNCAGSSNGAINTAISGGIASYNYLWSNGATISDISNISAGSYSLTVTDSYQCNAVITVIVTEPTALTAAITKLSDNSLVGSASGGIPQYKYEWNTGSTRDTIIPTASGIYTLKVTDDHGCTDTTSISITVVNQTGIASAKNGNNASIKVFPNPSADQFNVQYTLVQKEEVEVIVYDMVGVKIMNTKPEIQSEGQHLLNIDNLAKGAYLLDVRIGAKVNRQKIMKE